MKTRIFSLLVAGLLGVSALWAKPVNWSNARQVAQQFLQEVVSDTEPNQAARRRLVAGSRSADTPAYYVFETEAGGFVIVAADDCARPVLAYGDRSFVGKEDQMPPQVKAWLKGYENAIRQAVADGVEPDEKTAEAWRRFAAAEAQATQVVVAPLIHTQWDQNQEYINVKPTYNKFTPLDKYTASSGTVFDYNVPVGCVATAMAQVMKYWEWPVKGVGSNSYSIEDHPEYGTLSANFGTTYDWTNMPTRLTYNGSTDAQINAVATLMYHCGVAINMHYDVNGSGAFTTMYGDDAPSTYTALRDYFRYKNTLEQVRREDFDSEDEWTALLKHELSAGRPIVYAGNDGEGHSGHCFVCCGYDSDDRFYFNFGWNGNSDGYYALDAVIPINKGTGAGHGNYSYSQEAIVNVVPDRATHVSRDYHHLRVSISNYPSLSKDTIPYGSQSLTASIRVNNYSDTKYTGRVAVQLIDENDNVVLQTGVKSTTILSYSYENLTFTIKTDYSVVPGTYRVQPVYEVSTGVWVPVTAWHMVNRLRLHVAQQSVLNTYGIAFPSTQTWVRNQEATVTVNIANASAISSYCGDIYMALLSKTDLSIVQRLDTVSLSGNCLSARKYDQYTMSAKVTAAAGDYLLGFFYDNNGQWTLVGNRWSPSVFPVTVVASGTTVPAAALSVKQASIRNEYDNDTLRHYDQITITARIANTGNKAYKQGIGVVIYDNTFTNFIETYTIPVSIDAGYEQEIAYTIDSTLAVGKYCAILVYFNEDGTFAGYDKALRYIDFTVEKSSYILTVNGIELLHTYQTDTYTTEQSVQGRVTLTNIGDSDYTGQRVYLRLYQEDGTYLMQKSADINVPAGEQASATIVFSDYLEAGNYYLRAAYTTADDDYLHFFDNASQYKEFTVVKENTPVVSDTFQLFFQGSEILTADSVVSGIGYQTEQTKIRVRGTVKNAGKAAFTGWIYASLNDYEDYREIDYDIETVTIAAGATQQVTLQFDTLPAAGDYYVYWSFIDSKYNQQEFTTDNVDPYQFLVITAEKQNPAPIITSTDPTITGSNGNTTIQVGETIKATFTLTNSGTGAYNDSVWAVIYRNSAQVSKVGTKVNVASNGTKQVSLNFPNGVSEGGEYVVYLYGVENGAQTNIKDRYSYNTYTYFEVIDPASYVLSFLQSEILSADSVVNGTVYHNDATSIKARATIKNQGAADFDGWIYVSLISMSTYSTITNKIVSMSIKAGTTEQITVDIDTLLTVGNYSIYWQYVDPTYTLADFPIYEEYPYQHITVTHKAEPVKLPSLTATMPTILGISDNKTIDAGDPVSVAFTLTNSGEGNYNDSVWVYLYDYNNQLIRFGTRVSVAAGATKKVVVTNNDGLSVTGDYLTYLFHVKENMNTLLYTEDGDICFEWFTVIDPASYVLTQVSSDCLQADSVKGSNAYYNDLTPVVVEYVIANTGAANYVGDIQILLTDSKYNILIRSTNSIRLAAGQQTTIGLTSNEPLSVGTYQLYYFYLDSVTRVINYPVNMEEYTIHVIHKEPGTPTDYDAATTATTRVYPNPATDYVMVPATEGMQIALYDYAGRLVVSQIADSDGVQTLSVSHLPQGVYLLRMTDLTGKTTTQPLIKR